MFFVLKVWKSNSSRVIFHFPYDFVSNLIAEFLLSFLIGLANFLEILLRSCRLFEFFTPLWIAPLLCSRLRISPLNQPVILLLSANKWSLVLNVFDGFSSSILGMLMIALRAVSLIVESLIQLFNKRIISSIVFSCHAIW